MTNSGISGLALLLLAAAGTAASAQETAGEMPVMEEPAAEAPAMPQELEAPLSLMPRSLLPENDAVPDGAAVEEPSGSGGVSVDRLDAVDVESIGVLTESEGGFGRDMWARSDRAFIALLLEKLPASAPSPVMRSLTRRLIATTADVPPGPAEDSLLEHRLEALLAIGDFEAADALVEAAARRTPLITIDRVRAQRLLLDGKADQVCSGLPTLLSRDNDPYWQRMLIVCQAIAGDEAAATLGLDLLREEDVEPQPGFADLVQSVLKDRALPQGEVQLTPQTLALLRAAGGDVPEAWIATGDPALWRAMAGDDTLPIETRLSAAEWGARSGVVTPAELSRLYLGVESTPEERAAVLEQESTADSARDRALRYQAAREIPDQIARAEALRASWRAAAPTLDFIGASRAGSIAVLSLTPSPSLTDFGLDAVVVLLASGRPEAAAAWFRLLRDQAANEPMVADLVAALAPYMVISGADQVVAWDDGAAIDWYQTLPGDLDDATRRQRAARMFTVLESLGYPLGADVWTMILDAPREPAGLVPDATLLRRLGSAASEVRVGEAVALSLIVLGEGGPQAASAHAVGAATGALRQIGLMDEARKVALEAVLAPVR